MCACKKTLTDNPPVRNIGHHTEDTQSKQAQTHNMPPFLRLNSTGEVASDKRFCKHKCPKWCKKINKRNHEKLDVASEPHYFKNLVHNCLNMGTVIDTASGYIESASSYLGLNPTTRAATNSLVGNCWNGMKNFGCKDRDTTAVVSGKETSSYMDMPSMFNNENAMNKTTITPDQATMWPKGLLGAYDYFGKKMTCPNTGTYHHDHGNKFAYCQAAPLTCHPSYDKPRDVCELTNNSNRNSNHNSKPYNARLLENSKKGQTNLEERKDADQQRYVPPFARNSNNVCANTKQETCDTNSTEPLNVGEKTECKAKPVIENTKSFANTEKKRENCQQEKKSENLQQNVKIENVEVKQVNDMKDVQDWFEYESVNVTTIPVEVHATCTFTSATQTGSDNTKCRKATCKTMSSISHPLLQSWHSMEYDAGVKKKDSTCDISSQIFNVSEGKSGNNDNKADSKTECNGSEFAKVHVKMEKVNVQLDKKSDTNSAKPNVPSENEQLPFVLFVRNIQGSKKSRPSAKKRRRQKSKQEASSTSDETSQQSATPGNTKPPHNPISFILGIDSETCTSTDCSRQSFLMSCDINSDSDWSDSDLECDGGDSPVDDDFHDEFSLFSPFADQFNPLNFKVTCSIQPTPTTPTSSSIDAINLSWNVNISVKKEDTDSPKKASKKVHFASDKDLATVHRMVTWAHDYQDSRKGPWEVYARDRERFKRRVEELDATLSPVLTQQHRDSVFIERFSTN